MITPSNDVLPASVLSSMGVAVLRHVGDGAFQATGEIPAWLSELWPGSEDAASLRPQERFVFLEYFLVDAREVWAGESDRSWVSSGPWTEVDGTREVPLEAVALRHEGHEALILKFPTADYETVREILQKSREQDLAFAQLVKEINKRETLLHCTVHDLSSPLAGVRSSLKLLRDDGLVTNDGTRLVEIGFRQATKMQNLIADMLTSFRADSSPDLLPGSNDDAGPILADIVSNVATILGPVGREQQVTINLSFEPDGARVARVSADGARLERVVFNLVDNALRFAPRGTSVDVHLADHGMALSCRVSDRGPGVPDALVDSLFDRFSQGSSGAGTAGLGLYFCHITVNEWGGDIGYANAAGGGAAFTFVIPKAPAPLGSI